jgi:hypothetical protein
MRRLVLAASLLFACRLVADTNAVEAVVLETETWWLFRPDVDFRGQAKKDFFATGNNVNLSGRHEGDVWAAGRRLRFSGVAADDVRLSGAEVTTLDGTVLGKTHIFAGLGNALITTNAILAGPVTVHGTQHATVYGVVSNDLWISAPHILIDAHIGGNLTVSGQDVNILAGTRVGGNIYYDTPQELSVPSTVVTGTVSRLERATDETEAMARQILWSVRVIQWITAFLVGLLMLRLLPRFSGHSVDMMLNRRVPCLVLGSMTAAGVCLACVLLFSLTFGLGVALFLATVFLPMFYCGKLIAAFALGALILRHHRPFTFGRLSLGLLMGLALLYSSFTLPLVGTSIWLLCSLWGFGAMLQVILGSQRLFSVEIPESMRKESSDKP